MAIEFKVGIASISASKYVSYMAEVTGLPDGVYLENIHWNVLGFEDNKGTGSSGRILFPDMGIYTAVFSYTTSDGNISAPVEKRVEIIDQKSIHYIIIRPTAQTVYLGDEIVMSYEVYSNTGYRVKYRKWFIDNVYVGDGETLKYKMDKLGLNIVRFEAEYSDVQGGGKDIKTEAPVYVARDVLHGVSVEINTSTPTVLIDNPAQVKSLVKGAPPNATIKYDWKIDGLTLSNTDQISFTNISVGRKKVQLYVTVSTPNYEAATVISPVIEIDFVKWQPVIDWNPYFVYDDVLQSGPWDKNIFAGVQVYTSPEKKKEKLGFSYYSAIDGVASPTQSYGTHNGPVIGIVDVRTPLEVGKTHVYTMDRLSIGNGDKYEYASNVIAPAVRYISTKSNPLPYKPYSYFRINGVYKPQTDVLSFEGKANGNLSFDSEVFISNKLEYYSDQVARDYYSLYIVKKVAAYKLVKTDGTVIGTADHTGKFNITLPQEAGLFDCKLVADVYDDKYMTQAFNLEQPVKLRIYSNQMDPVPTFEITTVPSVIVKDSQVKLVVTPSSAITGITYKYKFEGDTVFGTANEKTTSAGTDTIGLYTHKVQVTASAAGYDDYHADLELSVEVVGKSWPAAVLTLDPDKTQVIWGELLTIIESLSLPSSIMTDPKTVMHHNWYIDDVPVIVNDVSHGLKWIAQSVGNHVVKLDVMVEHPDYLDGFSLYTKSVAIETIPRSFSLNLEISPNGFSMAQGDAARFVAVPSGFPDDATLDSYEWALDGQPIPAIIGSSGFAVMVPADSVGFHTLSVTAMVSAEGATSQGARDEIQIEVTERIDPPTGGCYPIKPKELTYRRTAFAWMGYWVFDEIQKLTAQGKDWETVVDSPYQCEINFILEMKMTYDEVELQESRHGWIFRKVDLERGTFYPVLGK